MKKVFGIWMLASTCLLIFCAACTDNQEKSSPRESTTPAIAIINDDPNPTTDEPKTTLKSQQAFFERISSLCGSRFEGQSSFPDNPDDSFFGKPLVAIVQSCEEEQIRIPFHVGENKSRTWILTQTPTGLELKHDHRHEDGTPDEITMYGGTAAEPGTATSQSFPADDYTAELLPEAATNEWFISLSEDGRTLTYYLERHGAPRFKATLQRVE